MAKSEARENFNKLIVANRKAASRNNVVLLEACANGKLNYIKTSIDAGADIHYTTEDNETPLSRCCQLSPIEAEKCIKYLVKRGCDTNYQDKYGRTTLSYIAEKGNSLIVDILISKCDADPTVEDCKGNTPLMYAVSAGSLDIVATLVGYFLVVNHPIDKRNLVGMTPLLLAAKMGRYECAKMLVEVGNANLHLRDVDTFRSAVDWIRYMCPLFTEEFMALDPIVVRKRDCATRRLTADKVRYRVLSEFFVDGKMPSCWRNSSKGVQEPRKYHINRTLCIVSDQDTIPEQASPPDPELDVAIDSILSNMAEPSMFASQFADHSTPRSMFDIPNLNENMGRFVNENHERGKFVERCDSAMSVVSAPSPTFPRLDEGFIDDPPVHSPTQSKPTSLSRNMGRRKSIDNSLLSRPQVNSPVVTTRRVARTSTVPNREPAPPPRSKGDPQRKLSDSTPVRRAAPTPPDPLRNAGKLNTISATPKLNTRTGRKCNERKTSLPNINKTNNIVRDLSYVRT